ncbi:MAG: PIN/TRAM domain-containing protein [Vulcanimicrobiaceae bacterium]
MRSVCYIRIKSGNISGTLLRIVFAVVFGVTGFILGREAYIHVFSLHFSSEAWQIAFTIVSPVLGAVIGVALAPLAQALFEDELVHVEGAIDRLSPAELAGGAVGLIVGLIIAFLIKNILFEFVSIGGRAGSYIAISFYLIISVFAAYLGARVGAKQRIMPLAAGQAVVAAVPTGVPKIVDTSVIIDGRITEIVESGFLEGPLILPRFVLRELQLIADSVDSMKRTRGRRGLEVLSKLQEFTSVEISERDYPDILGGAVDAKLVRLAQELGGRLLTNDYNLNKVAHVEGVTVLNINELASAVKPVVLPGEELHVQVIREGKEQHQGVGYLDDGTMIVVENGRRLVGEAVDVAVTSVLQTVAGRMIFARLKREQ